MFAKGWSSPNEWWFLLGFTGISPLPVDCLWTSRTNANHTFDCRSESLCFLRIQAIAKLPAPNTSWIKHCTNIVPTAKNILLILGMFSRSNKYPRIHIDLAILLALKVQSLLGPLRRFWGVTLNKLIDATLTYLDISRLRLATMISTTKICPRDFPLKWCLRMGIAPNNLCELLPFRRHWWLVPIGFRHVNQYIPSFELNQSDQRAFLIEGWILRQTSSFLKCSIPYYPKIYSIYI